MRIDLRTCGRILLRYAILTVIFAAGIVIARLCWAKINLPFRDPWQVLGPPYILKFNPNTNCVRYLLVALAPTLLLLIVYLVVAAAGVGLRDLTGVRRDLASGQSYQALAASSGWLKTNAVPNSIILHSDWDEFPLLFYHDTTHRYIAGLDATFLYDKDPDRYWAWVKITTRQADPATIHQTVRQTLAASYVILTKDHTAMDGLLKNTSGFRLVYEDSEAKIYRVAD